jgi:hypothetical protein
MACSRRVGARLTQRKPTEVAAAPEKSAEPPKAKRSRAEEPAEFDLSRALMSNFH